MQDKSGDYCTIRSPQTLQLVLLTSPPKKLSPPPPQMTRMAGSTAWQVPSGGAVEMYGFSPERVCLGVSLPVSALCWTPGMQSAACFLLALPDRAPQRCFSRCLHNRLRAPEYCNSVHVLEYVREYLGKNTCCTATV